MDIERDVPAPVLFKERGPKYPFAKMEVGDSFVVNGPRDGRVSSSAYQFARRIKRKTGQVIKFTVRTEGNTTRCWRIE